MTKVQLSLTDQEAAILSGYGSRFGYNLPKTIRFVISKVVENVSNEGIIPEYKMSEKTESIALQAIKDHQQGKTKPIDDIDRFLESI